MCFPSFVYWSGLTTWLLALISAMALLTRDASRNLTITASTPAPTKPVGLYARKTSIKALITESLANGGRPSTRTSGLEALFNSEGFTRIPFKIAGSGCGVGAVGGGGAGGVGAGGAGAGGVGAVGAVGAGGVGAVGGSGVVVVVVVVVVMVFAARDDVFVSNGSTAWS